MTRHLVYYRLASKPPCSSEHQIFLPPLHKCYACSCVWPHPAYDCSLYSLYMCPLSQICLTNIAFIPWAILGFLDISRPKHHCVFRMYKAIYFYIGICDFSFCSFECISFINVFVWLKGRMRRQGKGLNVQPLETQSVSNCTWLALHKVSGPFNSQAEMQEEPGEPHPSTDRIRGKGLGQALPLVVYPLVTSLENPNTMVT